MRTTTCWSSTSPRAWSCIRRRVTRAARSSMRLLHHCRALADTGDPRRPGIVHRLDRETSGLLVVALNPASVSLPAAQLQDRSLGRDLPGALLGHLVRGERGTSPATSTATRATASAWPWSPGAAASRDPLRVVARLRLRAALPGAAGHRAAPTRSASISPTGAIRWWATRSTATTAAPAMCGQSTARPRASGARGRAPVPARPRARLAPSGTDRRAPVVSRAAAAAISPVPSPPLHRTRTGRRRVAGGPRH